MNRVNMSIDNKIESEKEFTEEEIEKFGQHFKGLVGERHYDEARKFYSGLNADVRQQIAHHKEYRWYLKALQFSCM